MTTGDVRIVPVVPLRWTAAGSVGVELPSQRLIPDPGETRHQPRDAAGLWDIFAAAHVIEDIVIDPPPVAAGMWRLLTVIAARVTGLDEPDDRRPARWLARRNKILGAGEFDRAAVDEYFGARYATRFDLFDTERPWLQDPRLAQQCAAVSGLNKLVLGRPAGNNQPWMEHHSDRAPIPLTPAEAARHLIGQLYYGAPGQCTPRTVGDRKAGNGFTAPLRGLVSYHPIGANLFESLIASIPYPQGRDEAWDKAAWELDELPDPLQAPPPVSGVGGLLAGRFRHAVLLVPSRDRETVTDAYLTWAWRLPHGPAEDPFLIYQISQKGEVYPRPAVAQRALWRDLDGLLLKDVGIARRKRPAIFDQADRLPEDVLTRLRVRAFGFDQDRTQVNDWQWYSAETPPILGRWTEAAAMAGISRTREVAEQVERDLTSALRTVWTAINDPSNGAGRPARKEKDIKPGPWPALASSRYWHAAEPVFWRRVQHNQFTDPAKEFVALAAGIYDTVTDAARSPRARRAIENNRGSIYRAARTQDNHHGQ
ncbi:type I-E CRISPR-associated protein Cse1/CasA [Nocardia sp. NEAU-G5]|uniref:Type I-E CRISPR-associated protein Cse1/CasA n=1 Tax=Nocardia albiluteola TaxID=2842303 RepID=A0ABS6AYN0_9NOCA|nr:type I-E CRISPR-associated protein Cse1/CasA [Nocardia albiluteola]MBU3063156.1 type I-E CRISPR-associated protein Cse1/CasA [Nocardia albiluteola]